MALYYNWSKRDVVIKSIAWICNLSDIWNHLVVMEKIHNLHRCSFFFISHASFRIGWVKLFKVGSHYSFITYDTSYGRKKGWESKCQFDFRPLKIRNCLELHACRRRAIYCWKALNKGYNFALTSFQLEGCTRNYGRSK